MFGLLREGAYRTFEPTPGPTPGTGQKGDAQRATPQRRTRQVPESPGNASVTMRPRAMPIGKDAGLTTELPVAPRAPGEAVRGVDQLFVNVYGELKRLAHRHLRAEDSGHTLSTTALVHETYLRLTEQRHVEWSDRVQFFSLAARAMRRILVDYARRHRAARRGGRAKRRVSLSALDSADAHTSAGVCVAAAARADEIIALDTALRHLAEVDARLAQVVEYRFFAGLSESETASLLGVTTRTVARDWVKAKGWLYRALREAE